QQEWLAQESRNSRDHCRQGVFASPSALLQDLKVFTAFHQSDDCGIETQHGNVVIHTKAQENIPLLFSCPIESDTVKRPDKNSAQLRVSGLIRHQLEKQPHCFCYATVGFQKQREVGLCLGIIR